MRKLLRVLVPMILIAAILGILAGLYLPEIWNFITSLFI